MGADRTVLRARSRRGSVGGGGRPAGADGGGVAGALRLGLEPLEDRTVLTTILMVDSLLDDGVGETLRDAIVQANSGSDTEYVIEFSPR